MNGLGYYESDNIKWMITLSMITISDFYSISYSKVLKEPYVWLANFFKLDHFRGLIYLFFSKKTLYDSKVTYYYSFLLTSPLGLVRVEPSPSSNWTLLYASPHFWFRFWSYLNMFQMTSLRKCKWHYASRDLHFLYSYWN